MTEQKIERARFTEERSGGTQLTTASDWHEEICGLDLLQPGALDALLARAKAHPGGRGGAWHFALPRPDHALHIRVFAHGGWLRALTGHRLPSLARPLAELRVTAELRALGVPVPEPVFVLGERSGLFWRAAFATALERNARSGGDFLRATLPAAHVREAVRSAGRAVRRLHDVGGRHADLHVDNLLVVERGDELPRVVVTDLDRGRIVTEITPRRRMAELMRLERSLIKNRHAGSHRLAAVFLRAYVARDRELRAELLRSLPRERVRLARHSLLYRRGPD